MTQTLNSYNICNYTLNTGIKNYCFESLLIANLVKQQLSTR